jgi:hypothetical protein
MTPHDHGTGVEHLPGGGLPGRKEGGNWPPGGVHFPLSGATKSLLGYLIILMRKMTNHLA